MDAIRTTYLIARLEGREIKLTELNQIYKIEDSNNDEISKVPYINKQAAINKFNEYVDEMIKEKEKTNDAKAHV